MSDPQRRLLPYEHQLIEALGVTKEEYLDFVAQQHIYSDPKQGTILDATNWPAVAIVLTVVGIIFQVVAALIAPPAQQAPKTVAQQQSGGVSATRDEIFAPRFGFDSQQQLAAYGDPINLVYTNTDTNPDGGVRLATSLIWSALLSYGNSQLVRLLFVLCAGGIGRISEQKSAFGQTPLESLIAQNYWVYFASNYTGALQNQQVRPPFNGISVSDPTTIGSASANPYLIRRSSNSTVEGFSHCYSPTSANQFGIYGAVPINVRLYIRNQAGDFQSAINGISMQVAGSSGYSSLTRYGANTSFVVSLEQAGNAQEGLAVEEAKESRRALTSVFDNSGLFKIGSIKAKVISSDRADVTDGAMNVSLRSIEAGNINSVAYGATSVADVDSQSIFNVFAEGTFLYERRQQFLRAEAAIRPILDEDSESDDAATILSRRTIRNYVETGWQTDCGEDRFETYINEYGESVGRWVSNCNTYPTEWGHRDVRSLTDDEINALQSYVDLDAVAGPTAFRNRTEDYFSTKAIVRIEEASYSTVSACNIVDFSIKARIFKRVSGRQEQYGTERRGSGYLSADNGLKHRSSMFIVKIKKSSQSTYSYIPGIFVVRRSADIENFVYLRFDSKTSGVANADYWQFKFEPIYDVTAEALRVPELRASSGQIVFCYLENAGSEQELTINTSLYGAASVYFVGTIQLSLFFPPVNQQPPGLNEWDVFSNTSDSQIAFAFDNGPEFALAAITEQIVDGYNNYAGLYDNISLIGLNMYSGKSVQDLRSFTVFATQGRLSRLLRTSGVVGGIGWGQPGYQYLPDSANGYANTAPDIFIDTVLDAQDGIGRHASIHAVNLEQLAKSKKFCEANSLFMDGVIAEQTSWREFWARIAALSLLELAKVGGQDVLIPAVPYVPTTGAITRSLSISALFNQGNIIEDSLKEEFIDYGENTQDIIATIVYRKTDDQSVFNINATVDVQLADTVEDGASRKTVDASAFVTRRDQAIKLGKFLCNSKRYSQRAIEFKTFPTDSPVFPGAYIYVELAHNQWDGIYTGIIEDGGFLNMPITASIPNGSSYSMLVYSPNGGATSTQSFTNVTIANNRAGIGGNTLAFQNYVGNLFVVGTVVTNKRIFRVTEVQMDEEGEVTVRGVHHATDANGLSLISRGIAENIPGLFLIDGRPE
ncbi:MAG: hypothetical protein EB101_02615 [Chitinophagia bacterium]|nr:hypothetical protein [Chitinophagia bacterium]